MKQLQKKYSITQCALYKCKSRKRLERILTLETGGLRNIHSAISYHNFKISKKEAGEKRDITAPDKKLKHIQSRILRLLQPIERPAWLISGEKGKCYIDNGKAHIHNNYALTVDIKKFYDNCRRDPVYRFFHGALCVSADVAEILTDIVTHDNGIPTGCPTSQLIAYYAYADMFQEISECAEEFGCVFTLYVDDMAFSSKNPFDPRQLSRKIDRLLRKYGHKPKYRKVKYYSPKDAKIYTGTIVTPDNALDIPNSLQKKVYDNFQKAKELNDYQELSSENPQVMLTLLGQIQASKNIDSSRFPEISRLTREFKKIADVQQRRKLSKHNAINKGEIKIPSKATVKK